MATAGFPALMIRPPESPIQQVSGALQLAGLQQQRQLGQIQLEQAQRNATSQAALMEIWAKNNGDMNQTVADARESGQVTPEQLQAYQIGAIKVQTENALLQKDQLENKKAIYDMAANKLDAIKQLPMEQRGQAITDAYGELLRAGADPNEIGPHVQALLKSPTNDAITNFEVYGKGGTWAADQQLKALELASKPTAEQAQAKTQAELSMAEDEARMKHVELLSQPTPEFAQTVRQANLAKTRQETAKAAADTAKAKADTVLLGLDPVIGTNPTTKQSELVPLNTAKAGGYTEVEKASPADRQKYGQISSQLAGVQSAISHYRQSEQNPNLQKDDKQDRDMAAILSSSKILGTLVEHFPLGGGISDVIDNLRTSEHWNNLDDAHQQLLATYMTGKVSSISFQKITTGVGRLPQEAMQLEFSQVPSPTQAGSSSFKAQMDQYQDRINVASTAIVKVPGVATPAEVRQAIESQKTPLQPIAGIGQRTAAPAVPPTIQNVGEIIRQNP